MEMLDFGSGAPENEPPPAYSVRDPITSRGGIVRNPCPFPSVMALMERRGCSDPYSSRWPGCCRMCFFQLFFDFLVMTMEFLIAVITGTLLSKGPGWEAAPLVVSLCTVLLLCVRTTALMSRSLALLGRVSQAVALVMASVMTEISIGVLTSPSEGLSALDAMSVVCMAVSIAAAALTANYNCECLWMGPGYMWRGAFITTAAAYLVGMLSVMAASARAAKYILACSAVISLILAVRDAGAGLTRTCVFKAHRYATTGSVAPLGAARCPRTNPAEPRLREDDVPFRPSCYSTYDLGMAMLLLLLVPLVFALYRRQTPASSRVPYEQVALTAVTALFCGVTVSAASPPEPPTDTRILTTGRCTAVVFLLVGLLLSVLHNPCGPFAYTIGATIASMSALSGLRSGSMRTRLLAAACAAKAVMSAQLLAATMTVPAAWIVDTRFTIK